VLGSHLRRVHKALLNASQHQTTCTLHAFTCQRTSTKNAGRLLTHQAHTPSKCMRGQMWPWGHLQSWHVVVRPQRRKGSPPLSQAGITLTTCTARPLPRPGGSAEQTAPIASAHGAAGCGWCPFLGAFFKQQHNSTECCLVPLAALLDQDEGRALHWRDQCTLHTQHMHLSKAGSANGLAGTSCTRQSPCASLHSLQHMPWLWQCRP
jgi:hypothetical protein